jgi:transposase-like protein
MPWRETDNVKERMKFIAALESEEGPSFSELCRRFGISRQTGYEWKKRFEAEGVHGLDDRPPLAHRHPNATPVEMEDRVAEARKRYPTWGPQKLLRVLRGETPDAELPAPSTIGEILTRRGVVVDMNAIVRRSSPYRNRFTTATRSPEAHWRRTSLYPGRRAMLASPAMYRLGATSTPRLPLLVVAAQADGPSAPAFRPRPGGS